MDKVIRKYFEQRKAVIEENKEYHKNIISSIDSELYYIKGKLIVDKYKTFL